MTMKQKYGRYIHSAFLSLKKKKNEFYLKIAKNFSLVKLLRIIEIFKNIHFEIC